MVLLGASDLPIRPVHALIQRDLTEAAIAATRYRVRTGQLPRSWQDLISAGLLDAAPLDPFTGKPATMTASADHVLFTVDKVPLFGDCIQSIAATRPLWQVFASPSTRPAGSQ